MSKYKVAKLDDIKDVLGDYPGDMKPMKEALGSEQVAITYRRMPKGTGSKGYYGHIHQKQEEVIYVISGKLQVKVGDKIEELGPNTAIRIAPGTTQGVYNNEPEDVELLIISDRRESEDKVEYDQNFWPAE